MYVNATLKIDLNHEGDVKAAKTLSRVWMGASPGRDQSRIKDFYIDLTTGRPLCAGRFRGVQTTVARLAAEGGVPGTSAEDLRDLSEWLAGCEMMIEAAEGRMGENLG